jgi:tetratricopeptide (TPR) repeat protein
MIIKRLISIILAFAMLIATAVYINKYRKQFTNTAHDEAHYEVDFMRNEKGELGELGSKLLLKANQAFNKGDYQQALQLYGELSKSDKNALYYVGLCYYNLNDFVNCAVTLEEANERMKNDFPTLKLLAYTYYQLGDMDKSLAYTQQALAIRKDDVDLQKFYKGIAKEDKQPNQGRVRDTATVKLAKKLYSAKDYEGAVELYDKLSDSDNAALVYIGMSYYQLRDFEKAIEVLEKAATYNSKDFEARKFLSKAYYELNDLEKSQFYGISALNIKQDGELSELVNKMNREHGVQENYVESETEHFKIMFNGPEHRDLKRTVIENLEEAYRQIGGQLNYFPSETFTILLYTDQDFFDLTHAPSWAGGLFDGKIRIPVRGAEGNESELRRILFHEFAHALIQTMTPECPLWLEEGLAEHLSDVPPTNIGQIIPLPLLEKSFAGLNNIQAYAAYQESHAATAYLIERYGYGKIKTVLFALSKGASYNDAFDEAFSITYEQFVNEWGKE